MKQYLRESYYDLDSPVSYTGFSALWRKIKDDGKEKEISPADLMKWLTEQYVYSLHKSYKKPREYRKIIVPGIDEQWQPDLVEMKEFSEHNDGYNYLLCVIDDHGTEMAYYRIFKKLLTQSSMIDCYSRFAWCEKIKTKRGQETARAIEQIFNKGRTPNKLQFDMGKEFYNEKVKNLLKERDRIFLYRFRQESIYC